MTEGQIDALAASTLDVLQELTTLFVDNFVILTYIMCVLIAWGLFAFFMRRMFSSRF